MYSEATGTWGIYGSAMGLTWVGAWGAPGLKPVSGDFDGDGVSDLAVRSGAGSLWHVYSLAKTGVVAWAQACGAPGYAAAAADFDGDLKDDPLTYDAAAGIWTINLSRSGYIMAASHGLVTSSARTAFGTDAAETNPAGRCLALTYASDSVSFSQSGLAAFVGDFNGDNIDELGAYQPQTGKWYIRESQHGTAADMELGGPGTEPVVGDYDGDRIADLAVFERSSGLWVILMSSGNGIAAEWGNATSIPVPADYDGDGKTDPAIYQPETGSWWAFLSGSTNTVEQLWGFTGAQPAQADFDGDGRTDLAVFWPDEARWYICKSSGGTVLGQVFGWNGCEAIPADFDEDGKADLAVYWPAGGQWAIKSSAYGFTRIGTWSQPPGVADPARCRPVSARFAAGSDRRVCVLDEVSGQMLMEPAEPQFESALGRALLPMQDIKNMLSGPASGLRLASGGDSRPKAPAGLIVEAVLEVAESIIEDFEQQERDSKIELMNEKLDGISANLAAVMKQQENLLTQLSITRNQLESAIWQAAMSTAIKQIRNTHNELLKFNPASYRSLSQSARALKVSEYRSDYAKRDIRGSLSDIHTHLVGQGSAIPSSLDLWNTQLVAKVKSGQNLGLCYRSLEQYFTEILSYQIEGLQVYGHHLLYTNGVAGREVFESYVSDTFAPRIAEQTERFLTCVDGLAAASLRMSAEIAATPPPAEPLELLRSMYQSAGFLAASVSTGVAWGLKIHVIGEPENVQAYAAGNQCAYFAASDPAMTLTPFTLDAVRLVGNLRSQRYLSWTWWTDGSLSGYNKFKTETQVAMAESLLADLAAGDYVVCAPWGADSRGRQATATVRYYDSAMNPVSAGAANAQRFGSAVLFVRSQPILREGEKTQISNYMMGYDIYGFSKQIETARGSASIQLKTESIAPTPWYFLNPSAEDKATLILSVCSGDAADAKLLFSLDADIRLNMSSGADLWETMGPPGYGSIGAGWAQLGLSCGQTASWWSEKVFTRLQSRPSLEYTVPAGGRADLTILAFQRSVWPAWRSYHAGVWNQTRLNLNALHIYY